MVRGRRPACTPGPFKHHWARGRGRGVGWGGRWGRRSHTNRGKSHVRDGKLVLYPPYYITYPSASTAPVLAPCVGGGAQAAGGAWRIQPRNGSGRQPNSPDRAPRRLSWIYGATEHRRTPDVWQELAVGGPGVPGLDARVWDVIDPNERARCNWDLGSGAP